MPSYDEDHSDPRQYCRHGTFIGSWWGPDYMCGWCESGDEPPTEAQLAVQRYERMKKLEAEFDTMTNAVAKIMREMRPHAYCSALANGLLEMAETPHFLPAQGLYIYSKIES